MTDETNNLNEEVTDASGTEFKASAEVIAAAEAALGNIKDRSFSGRNPELGKMINCPVCLRRHRKVDVTYREHFDENGKKAVFLLPLVRDCKQVFKQMWVDEDLDTGELSIQYAKVPLPGQKGTVKAIVGAARFAKKRKNPHPNRRQMQLIRLVRKLVPDEYSQEDLNDARELAKEMLGFNKTIQEKYAHIATKSYRQKKEEKKDE